MVRCLITYSSNDDTVVVVQVKIEMRLRSRRILILMIMLVAVVVVVLLLLLLLLLCHCCRCGDADDTAVREGLTDSSNERTSVSKRVGFRFSLVLLKIGCSSGVA